MAFQEDIKKALTELPKGLDETYERMLFTISSLGPTGSAKALNVLKWILFAVRPLSPAELIAVISFPSTASSSNLSLKSVFDICQNLVLLDEGQGVVRFAHYSVQEFLLKQGREHKGYADHFGVEKGHTDLAEVCTAFLSTDESEVSPSLIDYTTFNWGEHVRLSGPGSHGLTQLCDYFLTPYQVFETWVLRVCTRHRGLCTDQTPFPVATPLLVAGYYQLWHIFRVLLHRESNPNSPNNDGQTALHLAAMNGSQEATRHLVETDGVEVDPRDGYDQTPLSCAAENGHVEVVEILLKKEGVNVDNNDSYGRTPLSRAAAEGHTRVVRLLLNKKGVGVDSEDQDGRTPLSLAAGNGHRRVVEMLLKKEGVKADSKDDDNRTPLSWAAAEGHFRVVEVLLKQLDVDMNNKDRSFGYTVLILAAQNGHARVVQMLLAKKGIFVDRVDEISGRTPLSWAAEFGFEQVVQVLLDQGVDVNSRDLWNRRTPLSFAADNGHQRVVQLLLERAEVDLNGEDKNHKTPLSWAAEKGHETVQQILMEKGAVFGGPSTPSVSSTDS